MGLRAIDITPSPDSHRVVLAGRNRQGKSSAFEALRAVLFGKRAFTKSPIRTGASEATASVDLDNGLKIELTIGQGSHKFRVTQNGKKPEGTAASILKSLVSDVSADPMKLASMEELELLEQIRKLTGLDTSDLDLQVKQTYDARTEVNREARSLKARLDALPPKHEDAPAEEVQVADLVQELKTAQRTKKNNDALREEADRSQELADIDGDIQSTRADIAELERKIKLAWTQLEEQQKARSEVVEKQTRLAAECAALVDPDIPAIEAKLATVQETNAKVQQNAARDALAAELAQKEQDSSALTQLIEDTEQAKQDRIAAVKMPMEGLELDGMSLKIRGVPLSQASHSEKMHLCVGLASLINPELAVLLVEEAYCCDDETLQMLYDIARKHDPPLDIWLETLNKQPGAFVIEAGKVAEVVPEDED